MASDKAVGMVADMVADKVVDTVAVDTVAVDTVAADTVAVDSERSRAEMEQTVVVQEPPQTGFHSRFQRSSVSVPHFEIGDEEAE
jgi:hypothetical protein